MIVTAKDAHDFCVVAATIIPVLVLTRVIEEGSPFEVAGQFIKQRLDRLEEDFNKFEDDLTDLDNRITQEQKEVAIERFRWRKRHELQTELNRARNQANALHERAKEYLREHSDALSQGLGTVKLLTTASLIVTASAICVGIVGEFAAVLGILGVIDRYLAISIPISCINLLLLLLAQVILARFVIGPETINYRWTRLAGNSLVFIVPLALLISINVFVLTRIRYTP